MLILIEDNFYPETSIHRLQTYSIIKNGHIVSDWITRLEKSTRRMVTIRDKNLVEQDRVILAEVVEQKPEYLIVRPVNDNSILINRIKELDDMKKLSPGDILC